ncbi:MAG: prepilin peptidase [Bacteroides sp.]
MFTILLVITVIDWRTYEIPFGLNVTIGVLGLIKTLLDYPDLLLDHIIGFFAVSAFMLICLYIGRLIVGADCFGGGDIKLMTAAGLFLGWKENILAFLLGCILGAVIHSIRMKVSKEDHVLAFGPYLAAGIMIASLWGSRMIEWYMELIF